MTEHDSGEFSPEVLLNQQLAEIFQSLPQQGWLSRPGFEGIELLKELADSDDKTTYANAVGDKVRALFPETSTLPEELQELVIFDFKMASTAGLTGKPEEIQQWGEYEFGDPTSEGVFGEESAQRVFGNLIRSRRQMVDIAVSVLEAFGKKMGVNMVAHYRENNPIVDVVTDANLAYIAKYGQNP